MTDVHQHAHGAPRRGVAKLVGADAELGNFKLGTQRPHGTGHEAAHALLVEIDGVRGNSDREAAPAGNHTTLVAGGTSLHSPHTVYDAWQDPQDVGRRYLATNGGCAYIDLAHLEICTPEVVSAYDFVASWHAMLRVARDAMTAANEKCSADERILVLVNSSDGLGNAYGSHLNFLVTRRLWNNLFTRRVHPYLFVLAAHQVSSIVYTGQGKVGAENGRPSVAYQISQRADFFDQLVGPQTTFRRPIVNSRNEALCGHAEESAELARLHCIFYDSSLCHVSNLLKVGAMQIVLSMLEADRLDANLMLDDPVTALTTYSHDPGLSATARLTDGRRVTAVELQSMFCEHARRSVDAGSCNGLVPEAGSIVALWEEVLDQLARRDFDALAPRLDWVLKRTHIERALAARGLDWAAPEAKHLDHVYASLDLDEGLYWALQEAGLTQVLVDDQRVDSLRTDPPTDTRAWGRAMLLRHLPRERILAVDWDRIALAPAVPGQPLSIVSLPDPLGDTRASWASREPRHCPPGAG